MRIFLLSFLFVSCATRLPTQQEALTLPSLKSLLKNVCLSSEGKGRFEIQNQTFHFDFESLHQVQEKKWLMGLDFPLVGEESLIIDWNQLYTAQTLRPQGSFFRLAYPEVKKRGKLQSLYDLTQGLALFLSFKDDPLPVLNSHFNCTVNQQSLNCLSKQTKNLLWTSSSQGLTLQVPLNTQEFFMMKFFNLKKNAYKRIKASVTSKTKGGSRVLDLDLFLTQCRE